MHKKKKKEKEIRSIDFDRGMDHLGNTTNTLRFTEKVSQKGSDDFFFFLSRKENGKIREENWRNRSWSKIG